MMAWKIPYPADWHIAVERALEEDLGPGDLTAGCFSPGSISQALIEAQAPGVVCGVGIAFELFHEVAEVTVHASDGSPVQPGTKILEIEGPTQEILERERTALNFLMRLSGVATLTAQYVQAVAGTAAKIVDTRKTTPGLRSLEKYAVRCGGGTNHRLGLFDAAMIKDNHIKGAGSIAEAVFRLSQSLPHTASIEVECETAEQVVQAIESGANIVMLDNMPPGQMREIIERHRGQVRFEASGGITLETVRAVAETGVDLISVGALTHSSPALSLHLELR